MQKHTYPQPAEKGSIGNLGTFAGVFTPSVLTILGIILFLRLGYVVGSAGFGRALLIIGLANAISVLTSFSLSAVATNLKVKGGGDYYLISRTLGVEFGGAIGIVLFLAQSVSIAFYCIGFGEALAGMVSETTGISPRLVAVLAVCFLFIFAWLGADWATRFQYVVMTLLAAALFSFFYGGLAEWDHAVFYQNWTAPASGRGFWLLFAIFFPAVTGFTQGVSMSGDLKDPGKSLPLGTFCAVSLSILVYFGVAMVFAGVLPGDILATDYSAMKRVARFALLIDTGVIAATLSSAMASFLGAPRILQSLAGDRIFPFLLPFAWGSGASNNPRRGILLSTGIAFATIALGNLNVIAPVVSMFFLISYGLLNYATFYEARSKSPSFRPRFRWFDRRLSLFGFLACLGAMLAIDLTAGVVAISVLFAIYQYLKRTAGPARWADSRRSYHLQQTREHLLAAAAEPEHPRDWRPQILAFTVDAHRRVPLLRFAMWIQGGSGLTTAVRIIEGEGLSALKAKEQIESELRREISEHRLGAFPLVLTVQNASEAVHELVQAFGIGPVKANIILLNFFETFPKGIFGLKELAYTRNLRAAFRLGCNLVVLDPKEEEWTALEDTPPEERRIDVWWWDDGTSRLMLLLAYLMTRREEWEATRIRVLAPDRPEKHPKAEEELRRALEEARIEAEPEIIGNATADEIPQHSADATVVFLPFRLKGKEIRGPFGCKLEELLPHLPVVALVLAAQDIDLDAQPEEGKPGETAHLLDLLSDARRKVKDAEKLAVQAAETAAEAEKSLNEMLSMTKPGADHKTMIEIEKAVQEAEQTRLQAEKAKRRLSKAEAKAAAVAKEAEASGVELPKEKKHGKDSGGSS